MSQETSNRNKFIETLLYTWATQPRWPYWVMLVLVPLGMLILITIAQNGPNHLFYSDEITMMLAIFLSTTGWLYGGSLFQEMNQRSTAVSYLLLPTPQATKWVVKLLHAYVFFPLIAIAVLYLALAVTNFLAASLYAYQFGYPSWESPAVRAIIFFFYMLLPGAIASGMFWHNMGILKGGLLFTGTLLLLLFFGFWSKQQYSGTDGTGSSITFFTLDIGNTKGLHLRSIFYRFGAVYLPSLMLLLSTWFFIKEKEC